MANGEHLQVPGHHGLEAGRLYLLSTKLSENNSLNPLVMKKLPSTLSMAGADGSKLVLLSAVGTVFCCGLDFVHFIRCLTDDRKWESARMAEAIRSFVNTFIQFRKLIMVSVNGPANGLEASILPLCDLVWANEKAWFQTPYTTFGQSPDGCSTVMFPKILGGASANKMLLCGQKGGLKTQRAQQTHRRKCHQGVQMHPACSLGCCPRPRGWVALLLSIPESSLGNQTAGVHREGTESR